MKKRFAIFLTILFSAGILFAQQDVEFVKDNFKESKDKFKEARKQLEEGDKNYEIASQGARGRYKIALELYLKANAFNPNNSLLNFKIGVCYLNSILKLKAIPYLEKAKQINPKVNPHLNYWLGYAYHLNSEWDKAIKEYMAYQNALSPEEWKEKAKMVTKRIEECNTGKELVKKPVRAFIDNVGAAINSPFADYGPTISADESMMIFTSRRDNTTGGMKDENDDFEFYEDTYISYRVNGQWTPATNIGDPINTKEHDASIALSADGQKFILYKGDNGGDIFECVLKGNQWSKPDRFSKSINTEYHESNASYSYDGNRLYFVSDKPGGYGGRDVYYVVKNKKGKWDEPINAGAVINTPYDEEGVYMHPDGKTMYFSSRGLKTMGGYDIFKTLWNDSTKQWSTPENLGYPINTPDDEVFFVVSASGKHGYYASFRPDGYGEKDIYMVTMLGAEKPPMLNNEDNLLASQTAPVSEKQIEPVMQIKQAQLTILKGVIKDALNNDLLEATIELTDNVKNEVIATFTSNSKTGRYLVSLPAGKNYGIAVRKEGYLFHSENFDIPAVAAYQEVNKDILLKKLDVGSKIILRNIFFDFDKATLRPESTAELERLIALLKEFPTVRIEISGHTDGKGSANYNQVLSENRAKSVVEYLATHGIERARLEFKGYGLTQPIATNDTDEGRQLNRRTEFKVLSK